jgi:deazaflavin-dependent oxidoreductase (nitroreductase family)
MTPTLLRLIGTARSGDRDAPASGARRIKRRVLRTITNRVLNPVVRPLVERGALGRGWALLETRGRTTGQPRVVPVGNGLRGDTFWIVTEHGAKAGYVRNIAADPRVRIFVGGLWRTGTAHALPDDDPLERQRSLPAFNARVVRLMGTDLMTVRIDLDPE